MATYVVEIKLPYERISSTFGVFHSTTDTMFCPTFAEQDELVAHMFAAEYSQANFLLRDYSESAQSKLAGELNMFLGEVFPAYSESGALLPVEWIVQIDQDEDEILPDASDLLSWYQDGDDRADVAQRAFHAWRKARLRATA